ncbi:MAG TPA: phosphate ABC transporter substrate-binding protein PstS family protein, partial [Actinomycetota bacterium]|nr:phosphate ABC transporter substrate-binding protein PstS family protein [Actinomycetota bacterium]
MMNERGWPSRLSVAVVALALVAAACGGDDDGGGGGGSAAAGESELSGEIAVSGSSTVEPISTLVAQQFSAENPDVAISVDGPGTGDGFELFCKGETDVSDASRPIEAEEAAACEEAGIEYVELKVAIDGITVLTSPENDAITCLDFHDLYALLGPESEGFENWSDANELAEEVGAGNAPYPDIPLDVTAPGEESGTYDSFAELVLEDIAYEERKIKEDDPVVRPDYQASANDNVILQGIEGSSSSLGWVGFSFFQQAGDTVKGLEIDGGDGCVAPTTETIADGSYPIARELFVYVDSAKAEKNPALAAYVDYYLSEDGLASVAEAGYVDLPEE